MSIRRVPFTGLQQYSVEHLREGSESPEVCLCEARLCTEHFTLWLRNPITPNLGSPPWSITLVPFQSPQQENCSVPFISGMSLLPETHCFINYAPSLSEISDMTLYLVPIFPFCLEAFLLLFVQQSLALFHSVCHSSFLEISHLCHFIFSYWWGL